MRGQRGYRTPNPANLKFQDVFKLKHISFLIVLYFFIFLGFNIYYTSFPINAVAVLNWSITQMGVFYSVQGPILRKALKKFSEEKLIVIGSLLLGMNLTLFVSDNITLIFGAVVLFALGNGLMWPSFMSIFTRFAGTIHQGAVQGVASSIGSLASIIGLVVGGLLYNSIGVSNFLIPDGFIFLVFILSFRLLKISEPVI